VGPIGAIIMGIFGAVFGVMGVRSLASAAPPWLLAVPVLIAAVLVIAAARRARSDPGASERPARVGRIIGWASAGEGVGIFLAVNIAINLGRPDLVLPTIALVVGLHFLPMAYAIPCRAFYANGAALLLASAIGFLLPQPTGTAITGVATALILWTASYLALGRQSPMRTR
jgi:hypothetical protein